MDPTKQKEVDDKMKELDGTDNKAKLGANAILAVSLAVAKVSSQSVSAQSTTKLHLQASKAQYGT